uniref:Replicase polyprotein 1ab n=1 Tax=Simian hemorrhagic fever virus TaxID=38143 RepID=A0A077EKS6_SHFV|nr:putative protein 1b [Simian hemorrhagic fever virus]AIL48156.1 putative protein 1b [Simian hemorrhagic fever virus]
MFCECPRSNLVVMCSGAFCCVLCGHRRRPRPASESDRAKYGPIVQYVEARVAHVYSGLEGRYCALEMIPITYGNKFPYCKPLPVSFVIKTLAGVQGDLTRLEETPLPGGYGVIPCWGPHLAAVGYLSPAHVGRDWFEGATHAIVHIGSYGGHERPTTIPFNTTGGDVYQLGTCTIVETIDHVEWHAGVKPGTAICPLDRIDFAQKVITAFPEGFLANKAWLGDKRGTLKVEADPETAALSFEHGRCWLKLFPDPARELTTASTFGYQLNCGVQGKYIARRLQTNGLKLVQNQEGKFIAYTFHRGSWLGHIGHADESVPPDCQIIARFDVLPYNEWSPLPLLKLPGKTYFGGNASSVSWPEWKYDEQLLYADSITAGFCWLQLFPPLSRKSEAQRAILAQQVNNYGVTGTYLEYRLRQYGIVLAECDYGEHYIYAAASDSSIRHISPVPIHDRHHVFVTRLTARFGAFDEGFDLGFGTRYGRRRGGGKKSGQSSGVRAPGRTTPDLAGDWGKAVDDQEKTASKVTTDKAMSTSEPAVVQVECETKPVADAAAVPASVNSTGCALLPVQADPCCTAGVAAKESEPKAVAAPSIPITFGAPAGETLPVAASPLVVKKDKRCISVKLTAKKALPKETFIPPPDGGCGVHAFAAIQYHINTGHWPEQKPVVNWAYEAWTTNEDIGHMICSTETPAALEPCLHARYVVRLDSDHWVVDHYPNRPMCFVEACAHGWCSSLLSEPTGEEGEHLVDCSALYDCLGKFRNGTEFADTVLGLSKTAHCCNKRVPTPRKQAIMSLLNRPNCVPCIAPPSQVRTVDPSQPAAPLPPVPRPRKRKAAAQQVSKVPSEQDPSLAHDPPEKPDSVRPPKLGYLDRAWNNMLARTHKLHNLQQRVFGLYPQLLSMLLPSGARPSTPRLLGCYFSMAVAMFFLFLGSPLFILCAVLAGVIAPSARYPKILCCCLVVVYICTLFADAISSVCDNDDADCRAFLSDLGDRYSTNQPVYITPGPATFFLAVSRNFFVVSVALFPLHLLLLMVDVLLVIGVLCMDGYCFRCFSRCVRKAPEEVSLLTIPQSRVSRRFLLDICDFYSAPPVDIIRLATGLNGCFRGDYSPIGSSTSVITADKIDVKKVSCRTVCSFPSCPSEAVKVLHVLSVRGQMCAHNEQKVEKVDALPCKNPLFPYDLSSKKIVPVDSGTYEILSSIGCDMSHLVIGDGDFFKVMGVPRPSPFTVMRLRACRVVGGGRIFRTALAAAWVLFFVCAGYWVQMSTPCGIGTNDPFCKSSFGVPTYVNQGVCHGQYCASSKGVSRATSILTVRNPAVAPYIVLAACLVYLASVYVPGIIEVSLLVLNALLPAGPAISALRTLVMIIAAPHLSMKYIAFFCCTTAFVDFTSVVVVLTALLVGWILARYTGIGGFVTPYDIHDVVKSQRDGVAVANAPPNTYLGAVRRAALTGKPAFFVANNTGIVLEGLLREKTRASNSVSVYGVTCGSGGLFSDGNNTVCLTATHVCGNNKAVVDYQGTRYEAVFTTKGDYASAVVPIPGAFPPLKFAPQSYTGRAYWYANTGVETGFVGTTGCLVFSGPGDSGSPIITPDGLIVGVHTGSDSKGSGAYTTPNGLTVSGPLSLKEMGAHYEGPIVDVPTRLPRNVHNDTKSVPQPLARLLESSINLEGGLGTIQLIIVAVVLWKYAVDPLSIPFVVAFFLLNEILPKCLIRCFYNYSLFCLAAFSPLASRIFFIRLLTAALNRNPTALICHACFAGIAVLNDFIILGDIRLALRFTSFYVVGVNHDAIAIAVIGALVCVAACCLELFGLPQMASVIGCHGSFDPTFLSRYVHEGIRQGVSSGFGTESLSTALACALSEDELNFLAQAVDHKAIVSAIHVHKTLQDYILSKNAKILRASLASVHANHNASKALASLDKFLQGTSTQLKPGDPVILLGSTSAELVSVFSGDSEYIAEPIRSHPVAGTICTLCVVQAKCEGGLVTQVNGKFSPAKYLAVAGKVLADHPDYKLENDGRFPRTREDRVKDSVQVDTVDIGSHTFKKMWNKTTGDVWYDIIMPESAANPLAVHDLDSAVAAIGMSKEIPEKDMNRLRAIISKLQGLVSSEALNLLTAAGCTSADRSGLVITLDYAKIITHHARTRAFSSIDFKVVSPDEAMRTARLSPSPQPIIASFSDDKFLLLRRHPPSLLDVLTKGLDATCREPLHSPGDQGIDGYLWDFEAPHSKEAIWLSNQIISACAARRGDAPGCYPYKLHPVRGDPYRVGNVLKNTRFGDVTYTAVSDSDSPWLKVASINSGGCPVVTDRVLGSTIPVGSEIYLPTLPESVLDYLDSRPDCPTYYTQHGCEAAALQDLKKFNLSTQGFILPEVLNIVRNYLLGTIGYRPAIYKPSTVPSNDSHAGINGLSFSTKTLQALPDIDELCEKAIAEVWQTVTPVTLKKQFCSKAKTRTILGTNAMASLALRALLSGVTQGFQLAGKNSPICLGKSKFDPCTFEVKGRCLETDLASCDRSTPAIVRHFATKLLFEMACAERALPLYVVNCCHDLIVTQTSAATKRGGLSSGDPVTSIANTIYSLVLYVQHMVLTLLENGHPLSLKFLSGKLTFQDLYKLQAFIVYSDDLILLNESDDLPNFERWVPHLELALGFKVDPKKTVITSNPGFLGCEYRHGWLVPQKQRVLAALAYHVNAKDVHTYYINATAILNDASALSAFEPDWFDDLVIGLADCARKDGYSFPGPAAFREFFSRVSGYQFEGKEVQVCSICCSTARTTSLCGMALCDFCAHRHYHPGCHVLSSFCKHVIGSNTCKMCSIPILKDRTKFAELLASDQYRSVCTVEVTVVDGYTDAAPGRYSYQKKQYMLRKERRGCPLDLPDGKYSMKLLPNSCSGICVPKAQENATLSNFVVGPPGSGKTTFISNLLDDDAVVYCPTHVSLIAYSKSLPAARFSVPRGQDPAEYGTPALSGPTLQLLSAGYVPGAKHYLDEACYANPFDVFKLLSKTPITAIGDPAQLTPVGFDTPLYVFELMKKNALHAIYRFGQNICNAIQPCYSTKLVSQRQGDTEVIFQTKFAPRGKVLTPYHRDRVGAAVTIDSSQGSTYDVVTLYLPTKGSLTLARGLVGITRARERLYVYDPHHQLAKYFNLQPSSTTIRPHAVVIDGKARVMLSDKCYAAPEDFPGMLCTARPATAADRKILEETCLKLDFLESGSLSPLPRVCYNLGFYYSPDITKLLPIPSELAKHWPVATNRNNPEWPNRLVVSATRLSPLSHPAVCAGYYVGDSLFVGTPNVTSYWLTKFLDGRAVPMEDSVYSTGRFEMDIRDYLDSAERDFAAKHPHAFIGDTKGTTVGGCHHITSQYLPHVLPADSVVKVGVSKPGVAHKALCTVTDIYLPMLGSYTSPPTQSKVYKVNVDHKACKLMVWRDQTMYFQEGFDYHTLVDALRFVRLSSDGVYRVAPELTPMIGNRRLDLGAKPLRPVDLAITPWDDPKCEFLVTHASPFDMSDEFLLVNAFDFIKEDLLGKSVTPVYFYKRLSEPLHFDQNLPPHVGAILSKAPRFISLAKVFNFCFTPTACHCKVSVKTATGDHMCKCSLSSDEFLSRFNPTVGTP